MEHVHHVALPQKPIGFQGVLSALAYGLCSIGLVIFNKRLLLVSGEPEHVYLLFFVQSLFSVVILSIGKHFEIVSYPDVEVRFIKQMLPTAVCFLGSAFFSLVALGRLSLSTYSILKRTGLISVMILETVLLRRRFSIRVQLSVLLVGTGAVLISFSDLAFDTIGCVCALLAMICKALNLVWVSHTGRYVSTSGIIFFGALISLPILLGLVLITDDLSELVHSLGEWPSGTTTLVVLVFTMEGVVIQAVQYLCIIQTSPLTTTVVGQLKSPALALTGALVFGELTGASVGMYTGHMLSVCGGILYSMFRYWEILEKDTAPSVV